MCIGYLLIWKQIYVNLLCVLLMDQKITGSYSPLAASTQVSVYAMPLLTTHRASSRTISFCVILRPIFRSHSLCTFPYLPAFFHDLFPPCLYPGLSCSACLPLLLAPSSSLLRPCFFLPGFYISRYFRLTSAFPVSPLFLHLTACLPSFALPFFLLLFLSVISYPGADRVLPPPRSHKCKHASFPAYARTLKAR